MSAFFFKFLQTCLYFQLCLEINIGLELIPFFSRKTKPVMHQVHPNNREMIGQHNNLVAENERRYNGSFLYLLRYNFILK